jgi:hypothetical protein
MSGVKRLARAKERAREIARFTTFELADFSMGVRGSPLPPYAAKSQIHGLRFLKTVLGDSEGDHKSDSDEGGFSPLCFVSEGN